VSALEAKVASLAGQLKQDDARIADLERLLGTSNFNKHEHTSSRLVEIEDLVFSIESHVQNVQQEVDKEFQVFSESSAAAIGALSKRIQEHDTFFREYSARLEELGMAVHSVGEKCADHEDDDGNFHTMDSSETPFPHRSIIAAIEEHLQKAPLRGRNPQNEAAVLWQSMKGTGGRDPRNQAAVPQQSMEGTSGMDVAEPKEASSRTSRQQTHNCAARSNCDICAMHDVMSCGRRSIKDHIKGMKPTERKWV